jgi:glycosyltransferase involved in cell wall biosynthesis
VKDQSSADFRPRVLIVTDNASERMGGEAVLPLEYFRRLRRRGIEAWLLVHERNRRELETRLPSEQDRVTYLPDLWLNRLMCCLGERLPHRIARMSTGLVSSMATQFLACREAKRLVAQHAVTVVHQPTPVSPREISLIFGLGAPVIIGPMNGDMDFPPAFRSLEPLGVRWLVSVMRRLSEVGHLIVPGKRLASALLTANVRTRHGLPRWAKGAIIEMVENGIDPVFWDASIAETVSRPPRPDGRVRILFVGRLIALKGVEFLLEAFRKVRDAEPTAALEIIGEGAERSKLVARTRQLDLDDAVTFTGWLTRSEVADRMKQADLFVMPSLCESGGNVVLEAMVAGLPVVATRWGGPADYLDDQCGLLVDPDSSEGFVAGLAEAMLRLVRSPELRAEVARTAQRCVTQNYDWEQKIDRLLEIYQQFAAPRAPAPVSCVGPRSPAF